MYKSLRRFQIVIFLVAFLAIPVYWMAGSGNLPATSLIEQRELTAFPKMGYEELRITAAMIVHGRIANFQKYFWKQFSELTFQEQTINATSDHFPGRITLIKTARGFDRWLIDMTYAWVGDPAVPITANSEFYITRDGGTVIKGLPRFYQDTIKALDNRLENLATIKNLYPEKNFYVFYFEELAYSKYDPRLPYFKDLDGGRSFDYFESHLPKGIILGKMQLTSINDFNEDFYHTDHHWNIRGAWEAYRLMYGMVEPHYSDISPILAPPDIKAYPALSFLGTYARDTLYPFQPEEFEIGTVQTDAFKIIKDGQVINYNDSAEYNKGIFEANPYVSHYAKYFGEEAGLLEYQFNNTATRNLLLFGTSYKIPLQPWIGSHYHKAYFVDLKFYRTFSLEKFIQEHQVDDIIILSDMTELTDSKLLIHP